MQVEPDDNALSYDLAGEFAAAMPAMAVRPGARLATAVSGGADSMALVLLLARWARENNATVHALTVDHALRDAAADEARQVAAWLAPLDIPHTTLRWAEGVAYRGRASSAQAVARDARYRLMMDWCMANGCSHLFVAHHADDQAETFLLRLARGSGVDGLAAMTPLVERGGIRLARPLLAVPKDRLVAYLRDIGQPWIEDPSNHDPNYGRTRLRAARTILEREGLSSGRLLATADHMRRARAALDYYVGELLARACTWDEYGVGRVDLGQFLAAPEEIGLRGLARVLMTAGGQVYRPRFERLLRLYESLRTGPWRDSTLHGCVLVRGGAQLTVAREAAQIGDDLAIAGDAKVIWDGRFEVGVKGAAGRFRVRRLVAADLPVELRDAPAWKKLPVIARETLPALFDSQGLAAVPPLNYLRSNLTTSPGVTFLTAFVCPRIDQFAEDDAEL
ncbi:MAG: tRNA lysidine(34) synthetase TilS [Rhodospirillaceae bacterium]